jgi:hypothetical protein
VVRLKATSENYDQFFASLEVDDVADIADILTEMTSMFPDASVVVPLSISLFKQARFESTRRRRFLDQGVAKPAQIILARLLERSSNEDRITYVNRTYSSVRTFESKYRVLKVIQWNDSNGTALLGQEQVEQLSRQFALDFKATDTAQLAEERWLLFLATEIMNTTSASPTDIPDFLATPKIAWAFLRSSVQQSLSTRLNNEHYGMDVVAVDKVLGSRDRTIKLIQICKAHSSGREDDANYTLAAEQAVNRANSAVLGGNLSS